MQYFVTGHQGSDGHEMIRLKSRLVTFCGLGCYLELGTCQRIQGALATGDYNTIASMSHTTYPVGTKVPNLTQYPCVPLNSGIYTFGDSNNPLRTILGGSFSLKDFSDLYPDADTLYWLTSNV